MTAPLADVTFDSVLHRSDDVLFQEVAGESVLLDLASEQYFGLDPVGTRIWDLIDGKRQLGDIQRILCAEYDAEPQQIGNDLLALAKSLVDTGLAQAA